MLRWLTGVTARIQTLPLVHDKDQVEKTPDQLLCTRHNPDRIYMYLTNVHLVILSLSRRSRVRLAVSCKFDRGARRKHYQMSRLDRLSIEAVPFPAQYVYVNMKHKQKG
jgi:hypothetical protein